MPKWLSFGGGVLALLIGIIATVWDLKRLRLRYVENIPISCQKVWLMDTMEIKGKTIADDAHRLTGPLAKNKCTFTGYLVTEKESSGKNRKTVVIEDSSEMVPFLCEDKEGFTRVVPFGASFKCDVKKRKKSGARTYTEWSISESQDIYILGSAVIEPLEGETLQMAEGK